LIFIIFIVILVKLNPIDKDLNSENKNSNAEEVKKKIYGDDKIVMYYFHWVRCPHCIEQNKFNKKLLEKYPNLEIKSFEVTDPNTKSIYESIAKNYSELPDDWKDFPGTPITIIGNFVNIGYGNEETSGKDIENAILKEQEVINRNWDNNTMKKTVDLN
jgi:hypothetical protein